MKTRYRRISVHYRRVEEGIDKGKGCRCASFGFPWCWNFWNWWQYRYTSSSGD